MFSSSNKTGLDECRQALIQWLEAEPEATAEEQ
jgi:GTP-binding protein